MKKWLKRSVLLLLGLILILTAWNYQLVKYGLEQAYGQLSIIRNTRPVNEVLADPQIADSLKQKIILINEIRRFAFDSLGINRNENYTSFYDQKGKPILWVVTACPPFEMKAYEWEFPLLGNFSYKGYFDHNKALSEAALLKQQGFDTDVGEVSAWSTLGWLEDPILSSMLKRKPGSLSNLIIHELTHGTLYVKNNVDFNENLASFVGDYGARKFLEKKYGKDSKQFSDYEKDLVFNREYSEAVLAWAKRLDSLYKSFTPQTSVAVKQQKKTAMIGQAKDFLRNYLKQKNYYTARSEKEFEKMNNAYFIDYIQYRSQQNIFEEEFRTKFNSDFPRYMNYLKEKYPGLN